MSANSESERKVDAAKKVQFADPPRQQTFTWVVKFVCGEQPDCLCECASVRPGKYATSVIIYNHSVREARITKRVVPVIFAGAPVGREPKVAGQRAADKIVLPAHSATMDDCCRLTELLFGSGSSSGLNVGFLEISADAELFVTAVHTSTGINSRAVSIDVDEIRGRQA